MGRGFGEDVVINGVNHHLLCCLCDLISFIRLASVFISLLCSPVPSQDSIPLVVAEIVGILYPFQ